jgi:hypothetical protein
MSINFPIPVQTFTGQPAASGVNVLVAGSPGKQIYILSYSLQSSGTTTAQLVDTASNNLSPPWSFQAREHIDKHPIAGGFLAATAVGAGLNLVLGAAVGVLVDVHYLVG